jgi:hypothetical protein|tara:strand:+ start:47591 stop:47833 length:243 start_codon:yes stop_codon:yes gene_type:complete
MKLNLYYAVVNRYRSEAQEALSALEMFLNEPSAVSGHSDFVDEIKKSTDKLVMAEKSMETLNKYFGAQVEKQQNPKKEDQ